MQHGKQLKVPPFSRNMTNNVDNVYRKHRFRVCHVLSVHVPWLPRITIKRSNNNFKNHSFAFLSIFGLNNDLKIALTKHKTVSTFITIVMSVND